MFFVLNKSKIYTYAIALTTVIVLFVAVSKIDNIVSPNNAVVETSTNIVENIIFENEVHE